MEEEDWREVARLARKAEQLAGRPQDIEWTLDPEKRLWLLQSRPITTLG
jgi:pyruvate,water dikinase